MGDYWAVEPADLLGRLGSGADGLRQGEAERRLTGYRENRIVEDSDESEAKLLLRQFESRPID
jgi:hypothetical protein